MVSQREKIVASAKTKIDQRYAKPRLPEVCDECSTAFYDEGLNLADVGSEGFTALELGADIADHRCEYHDDRTVVCDCQCHRGPRSNAS